MYIYSHKDRKNKIIHFLLVIFFLTGLFFQNSFSSARFSKDSLRLHDYIEKGIFISACLVPTAMVGWVLLVMYATITTDSKNDTGCSGRRPRLYYDDPYPHYLFHRRYNIHTGRFEPRFRKYQM
jgi:hypothetical protein